MSSILPLEELELLLEELELELDEEELLLDDDELLDELELDDELLELLEELPEPQAAAVHITSAIPPQRRSEFEALIVIVLLPKSEVDKFRRPELASRLLR